MKKIIIIVLGIFVVSAGLYFSFKKDAGDIKKEAKEVENTQENIPDVVQEEVQDISVLVDGSNYPGYFPNVTEVKKGKKVRVTFITENEESCAMAVNIAEAGVYNKILPTTGATPIEFTPKEIGEFVIYCGMNGMFNATIKVVA